MTLTRLISKYRLAFLGLLGLLLAMGFLQSQTRSMDHSRYRVLTCMDSGELMNEAVKHRGTTYEDENKAALKTDCDTVLIGAGMPVLYMGRDYLGRHLVLVKTPN